MERPSGTPRRHRAAKGAGAVLTGLAAMTVATLGANPSSASSHREAPYIAGDPRADNTDVYAFVSPDAPDTVTLIANWWPMEEPDGGPNFYRFADGVAYDIEIDNNGDAQPDVTYRWVFTSTYRNPNTFLYNFGPVTTVRDADLNFLQTYDLQVRQGNGAFTTIADDQPVAPSNVGKASMPDYAAVRAGAVVGVAGGLTSFAGQADDPFFLDLRVFDLLYGGDLSKTGHDTLDGYNVQTIALKVPKSTLALAGDPTANPVIGVVSTTSRQSQRVFPATGSRQAPTDSGAYVQVSRLGNPLVNEVIVPVRLKDAFNASRPPGDATFLSLVQNPEVPRLIETIYDVPAPATPRNDLVEVFLTGISRDGNGPAAIEADLNAHTLNAGVTTAVPSEQLRLNMAVPPTADPKRLGVLAGDLAGFPNGRRLVDDVVDIELKVLQGALFGTNTDAFTDGVDANDVPFASTFPYVALPHGIAVNRS
ncbi:uncharacterized protein DUF4331 [Kineococcus xinjiangensis]|uniref:Uncharacterized protein DUF4331 n=1 Tax=Kineococcus xinjiangensis TaxID=512762 RepID=A0A2S6IPC5_9ACTN|nr:DUF4331 domain-containing protein [Kineococcus xinjiangensis]PPK95946.1 uncharacterized protein DUF4331 [Kineococcus xinjiangensis]